MLKNICPSKIFGTKSSLGIKRNLVPQILRLSKRTRVYYPDFRICLCWGVRLSPSMRSLVITCSVAGKQLKSWPGQLFRCEYTMLFIWPLKPASTSSAQLNFYVALLYTSPCILPIAAVCFFSLSFTFWPKPSTRARGFADPVRCSLSPCCNCNVAVIYIFFSSQLSCRAETSLALL